MHPVADRVVSDQVQVLQGAARVVRLPVGIVDVLDRSAAGASLWYGDGERD
jgi:hypothetical protein